MRKKEIALDGQAYLISPLSLAQTEEFLAEQKAALGIDAKGEKIAEPDAARLELVWRKFLCTGLNNAGADPIWTAERIVNELDMVFFEHLRDAVLGFSGLGAKEETVANAG